MAKHRLDERQYDLRVMIEEIAHELSYGWEDLPADKYGLHDPSMLEWNEDE